MLTCSDNSNHYTKETKKSYQSENIMSVFYLLFISLWISCSGAKKTLHCLTLFSIFSVHINQILLSTDITQNMSRSNKSLTWSNTSVWISKVIVDEITEV